MSQYPAGLLARGRIHNKRSEVGGCELSSSNWRGLQAAKTGHKDQHLNGNPPIKHGLMQSPLVDERGRGVLILKNLPSPPPGTKLDLSGPPKKWLAPFWLACKPTKSKDSPKKRCCNTWFAARKPHKAPARLLSAPGCCWAHRGTLLPGTSRSVRRDRTGGSECHGQL